MSVLEEIERYGCPLVLMTQPVRILFYNRSAIDLYENACRESSEVVIMYLVGN